VRAGDRQGAGAAGRDRLAAGAPPGDVEIVSSTEIRMTLPAEPRVQASAA